MDPKDSHQQPPPYGMHPPPPSQPPPYSPNPQYGPPPPPVILQQNVNVSVQPFAVGVPPPLLGSGPTALVCRSCGATVVTRTVDKPSANTHMLAVLLCLISGILCCWVPYCAKCSYQVEHYCPNCNAFVGVFVA